MPFCPKCKYEYRPEIEKCPDCDTKLVSKLPVEKHPKQPANLVVVASYPFDLPAQEAKLKLASHGIHAVLANEIMSQTDIVLVFADGGVKVLVVQEDAPNASKILEREQMS